MLIDTKWAEIKTPLHHAYIVNNGNTEIESLQKYLKTIYPKGENIEHIVESFGVEDARFLARQSFNLSSSDQPQIFLISFSKITEQAQNTLLKVFEEPSSNTYFFLCVSKELHFLPTLLSRFFVITPQTDSKIKAIKFVDMGFEERMGTIDALIAKDDLEEMSYFLNQIEIEIHDKIIKGEKVEESKKIFNTIVKLREFIRMPSTSKKQMLNYLASTI